MSRRTDDAPKDGTRIDLFRQSGASEGVGYWYPSGEPSGVWVLEAGGWRYPHEIKFWETAKSPAE